LSIITSAFVNVLCLSAKQNLGNQTVKALAAKKTLKSAFKSPKTIALVSSALRCGRLISHIFWGLREQDMTFHHFID
jgi:hypothetical protein